VVHHTGQKTLEAHIHHFTLAQAHCCTDEWLGYDHNLRAHSTVNHGQYEWARHDDGDGIREIHVNTIEGMWTDVRTFLRLFKGVNKRFFAGYIAMVEFRRNIKRVSPDFIAALVASHTVYR
jgi:transposase-like protein